MSDLDEDELRATRILNGVDKEDDEKKAIDYINNIKDWWWNNSPDRVYAINKNDIEQFDIILNLIEKQQKEIEELKEKNINLQHYMKEYLIPKSIINLVYTRNDKIKAKIEELMKEGNYRTADNPNGRVHFQKEIADYQIEVLQSLLEKE